MARQATNRQPANRQPANRQPEDAPAVAAAFLSGTMLSATESQMVSGGRVLGINLTAETWVAAGATFDAQRQNIIDGVVSAQAEAAGFNALRASIPVVNVVRVSDVRVEITVPAFPTYEITVSEVLTVTVPATSTVGAVEYAAAPTAVITADGLGDVPGNIRRGIHDTIRVKQRFTVPDIDRDYPANL